MSNRNFSPSFENIDTLESQGLLQAQNRSAYREIHEVSLAVDELYSQINKLKERETKLVEITKLIEPEIKVLVSRIQSLTILKETEKELFMDLQETLKKFIGDNLPKDNEPEDQDLFKMEGDLIELRNTLYKLKIALLDNLYTDTKIYSEQRDMEYQTQSSNDLVHQDWETELPYSAPASEYERHGMTPIDISKLKGAYLIEEQYGINADLLGDGGNSLMKKHIPSKIARRNFYELILPEIISGETSDWLKTPRKEDIVGLFQGIEQILQKGYKNIRNIKFIGMGSWSRVYQIAVEDEKGNVSLKVIKVEQMNNRGSKILNFDSEVYIINNIYPSLSDPFFLVLANKALFADFCPVNMQHKPITTEEFKSLSRTLIKGLLYNLNLDFSGYKDDPKNQVALNLLGKDGISLMRNANGKIIIADTGIVTTHSALIDPNPTSIEIDLALQNQRNQFLRVASSTDKSINSLKDTCPTLYYILSNYSNPTQMLNLHLAFVRIFEGAGFHKAEDILEVVFEVIQEELKNHPV